MIGGLFSTKFQYLNKSTMNLIINSYGTSLVKENDLFVVLTPDGKQSFLPTNLKSISIGKSAKITSDAIF